MNDVRYKGYGNLSKKKEISVIIYKDNSWEFFDNFYRIEIRKRWRIKNRKKY